ncbi:Apolipoprotein N-acyltransferase [Novipirellula galeiformis]|uniref:Apolipoprotein N-acyltransferase n=2 Tax=Novipirellula galeiformis TaxID=2528004 RepID=A0A5C6CPU3_9BACT|nr:Apolipoprotein N-acyltransferase [Novipirellula galeiformis]
MMGALACVLIAIVIGVPWVYPDFFFLGAFGWVALVVFASRARRWVATFASLMIGMISLGIAFYWAPKSIYDTTHLSATTSFLVFLALLAWESIAFALLGFTASLLSRPCDSRGCVPGQSIVPDQSCTSSRSTWLWLLVPVWVVIEFFHPQIFGWSIAHTALSFRPIIQVAELAGTSGIAFLVMLGVVSIAQLWMHHHTRRDWIEFLIATTMIAIACLWGHWSVTDWQQRSGSADSMRIAAVQVDPSKMGSVEEMQSRSTSAAGPIDLYIWPESSLGHYHISLEDFRDEFKTVVKSEAPNPALDPYPGVPTELLAGGKTYDEGGRDVGPYRNTAFLIDSSKSIRSRYVKRSLLPIGEYVPGEKWFPFLRDWAALDSTLLRGSNDAPLTLRGDQKVGVLVCYEDMVAENSAATTRAGAECLVALINGSRFTDTTTLKQHMWLAQLRAVENRRALVRCAATGISCIIQPDGSITERLPPQTNGVIVASIPLVHEITVYTQYGEWFAHLMTIIVLVGLISFRRRRSGASAAPPQ